MKKWPIIIKPGHEFQLNDTVFVYELNKDGIINIKIVRQILPKIIGVTVVKPKRKNNGR